MPKDRDPDPSTEEIQYILQQAILRDYPNPERKGCLESVGIRAIAEQRLPHEDPQWRHVSRCSPCYKEFLDSRREFREQRKTGSDSR